MAKIYFDGIDKYAEQLETLFKDTERIIKSAVYKGAGVVADEIKAGLSGIPVEEGKNGLPPVGTQENPITGISRKQKSDLINSFGLAPMENENGYIQTKAGVDGYGSVPTKKYPKGLPNALLMRSVESGTSFRKKHPVFRPAVNRIKGRAEQTMDEELNEQISKIMK